MKRWIILLSITAVVILSGSAVSVYLPIYEAPDQQPTEVQETIEATIPDPTNVIEVQPQSSTEEEAEEITEYYHLGRFGNMVALFDETGTVLEVYEIFVHLLPPDDAQALSEGIRIDSEDQLRRLLEDFGG